MADNLQNNQSMSEGQSRESMAGDSKTVRTPLAVTSGHNTRTLYCPICFHFTIKFRDEQNSKEEGKKYMYEF